jgi:hypothetical protein
MTGSSRFVGVHELAAPATTAARYPGARWSRAFVSAGGRALPSSTTGARLVLEVVNASAPALTAGGGCMVSIKLDMVSVAAGLWDERLAQLGVALAGWNVIVVFNHEPENDMAAAVFTAGFTAARTAFKSTAPMVPVGYAAMAYQWRPGSKSTGRPQDWAQVQADLYLCDAYSGQTFPETAILPEHAGWVRWYGEMIVKNPGRVWLMAERGFHDSPLRPFTILREAAWLATDPIGQTCAGVLIWATGGTEANPAWLLSDVASRQAVAGYTAVLSAPVADAHGALLPGND